MSLNRTLAGLIDTAGDVKSTSLDNVSAGLTVYATLNDLPTTGLTSGDQAYVSATSRFYISNGSGWYNVALVNATTTLSIDPSGVISLNTDGSTTTITLTGTDSDYPDANLTYSVESDGSFAGMASISQDSSVFTITPLSEDSATTTSATLTFKASDGISFGSGTRTLTLNFKVQNSNYTTLLTKADTAGTDNQVDVSTNAHTITENGNVTSTALSPYHPGGYSTQFDGGASTRLTLPSDTGFAFDLGAYTVEAWIYISTSTTGAVIFDAGAANGSFSFLEEGGQLKLSKYGTGVQISSSAGAVNTNQWHHCAIVRTSNGANDTRLYVDGVLVGTGTDANNWTVTTTPSIGGANFANYTLNGYIRDLRVVKGTAVYTSAFTPPTGPLTTISGTTLLTCHLPYIADGSTDGHAITVNGNPSTKRFGPYDYLGYTKTNHLGSVYFDGTGDWLTIANGSEQMVPEAGDFTVEFWFYTSNASTRQDPWSSYTSSTGWAVAFSLTTAGDITPYYGNSTPHQTAGGQFEANVWNHFAMARSGTSLKIFMNGKTIYTDASDTRDYSGTSTLYIGAAGNETNPFNGYISDARFVKGSAVYTADFTPPTEPLTAITNTQLLTCTNKNDIWNAAEGKQIIKSGSDASNTQRKFATSSAIYFDGTSGLKYDPGVDNLLYNFSTDDWTIEFWFRPNNGAATYTLLSMIKNNSGGLYNTPHIYMSSSNLYYYTDTNNRIIGGTPVSNTWHHFALTRSGNDHKMFLDGTQVGSTWTNAYTYAQGRLTLGNYYQSLDTLNPSNIFAGYMQDIRITKGLARYTAAFTPPTAEFDG